MHILVFIEFNLLVVLLVILFVMYGSYLYDHVDIWILILPC